ncbi:MULTISPECIES: type IV pilus twitching motility protein PilT [unclassified Leucobacter]|uniref:type IV pilus twitching motility protein PilT n=1 Tax=unclassified Leucobacter TaxID=2621730 RepID=UPI00165DC9FB|nr:MULTISPECIES: type IV pilus twitching motility protein PilT [unclassified Leucobacter]MBC9925927.1 type IV pilus twitching motility protein PilT [Leucobacter sp. cx-169]MBC9935580.1 type IV pilus twitching motility protein PilT [Leucobacter sp. cx-87]
MTFDLDQALRTVAQQEGSDLHLAVGSVPMMRHDGHIMPLPGEHERFTPDELRRVLSGMLTPEQREVLDRELELDLAYSAPGIARFRVNLYWQRGSMGGAFRLIQNEIRALDALGMPPQLKDFAYLPRGMVLVTGPTGSGKSTTLASLIDVVNRERASHIMTVEDPIEFLHRHQKSIVNQREVGSDTHTFAAALKHVLRQDPDVILVGELRDLESISVALTAAETGHLVFATLHTVDAAQSIDRIVDVFPPYQQGQIRTQLAGSLQGVLSQTLLRKRGGGRVVATELLKMTPAISHLVREGKSHQIYSMLQSGGEQGMHTMDQSLAALVRDGVVDYSEARDKASDLASFESLASRLVAESDPGERAETDMGLAFDDGFGDFIADAPGRRGRA